MTLSTGQRLGPYEILGPIGIGGMGEVYRARDTRLGREVAVKVILGDASAIPDRLPRFEREAKAIAALNHPNILALHDIGNEAGIVYAVMELLEGETLRARLKTVGRLTPLKAIDYATQIARGLAAAHERGIVHRDVKPENLFITGDGRVKILDFGLAQQEPVGEWDENATRFTTSPGVVLGTSGYMSPEQVLGQPATARSDLFAFGVVVYEMLTGTHPFLRATPADTATAILREDPPPMGVAAPTLPAGLVKILDRCLDKHATDRPSSARDLALFLEAVGSAGTESTVARMGARPDVRRVRNRILGISCGLLILLSVVTWGFVRVMTGRAVTEVIDADLARAGQIAHRVQRDRLGAVASTARLVASFPELKALFETKDAPTIRDFLQSYQQRLDIPLLMALGPDGRVIARTDEVSAVGSDDGQVGALVDKHGEPTIVQIRDLPYHAAAAAADAGGNLFGHIVGAVPIDEAFAAALREATQGEVVLMWQAAVLASTLRAGQTPWRSLNEWRGGGGSVDRAIDVSIGEQPFAAREIALADSPRLAAIVLKSRNEASQPFRGIQDAVVVIGLLSAAVAAIGCFWIARVLTSTLA